MMLRKQKKLYNVRAENVLKYIFDLIKPWGNLGKVTRPEYIYLPFPVEPPEDNCIAVKVSLCKKTENTQIGLAELRNPLNNLTAVVFDVWQLQNDTVLLSMRYLEIGLPVNVIWGNILATFLRRDEDQTALKAETVQTGKAPRLPKGQRLNEWRSIWRHIKMPYRGGGMNYKQLAEKLPPSLKKKKNGKTISEKLIYEIIRAAEFHKWE
jgi:hypothetical protein